MRIITCVFITATLLLCGVAEAKPTASRSCLSYQAWALLDKIEQRFGPVNVISTCRPGARVRGTGRPSRHASGNAIDFRAGARKAAIVEWLAATHMSGGTMTYAHSDHIHVDIGPRFVSLNSGGRGARKIRTARAVKHDKPVKAVASADWVAGAFVR